MNTKLTLNVDDSVIARAKEYAQKGRTSLSKLVENYLKSLTVETSKKNNLSPIVGRLKGAVSVPKNGDDFKNIVSDSVMEKYS